MRIIAVFGSLQRGGAETMFMNLYRCIDHQKYKIDFLVKERVDNGYEEEVRSQGSKIIVMGTPKKMGIVSFVKNLTKVLKDEGPYDVLHSNVNIMSGLVLVSAKAAKIPVRITHSHNTVFGMSKANTIVGKLLIHFFSTNRIACGEQAGKALFNNDQYMVLPNGIDTKKFIVTSPTERVNYKSQLGLDEKKKWVLHIGRFSEQKNHVFLLKMFAKLLNVDTSFRLLLCGEGPFLEDMKRLSEELSISAYVYFLGSIPNANAYLKAADIFILPSLFEGLPVSAVEAQCASLPCILSSAVTSETDFGLGLVQYIPLDAEQWVSAIRKQKELKTFVSHEAIEGKFRERCFDVNKNTDTLISFYESAK